MAPIMGILMYAFRARIWCVLGIWAIYPKYPFWRDWGKSVRKRFKVAQSATLLNYLFWTLSKMVCVLVFTKCPNRSFRVCKWYSNTPCIDRHVFRYIRGLTNIHVWGIMGCPIHTSFPAQDMLCNM